MTILQQLGCCFSALHTECSAQYLVGADRHELLQLVDGVEVATALQQLAGGDEVAAPALQRGVQTLQLGLQHPQPAPLQTGHQHRLQEHLLRTLLTREQHREKETRLYQHISAWSQLDQLLLLTCKSEFITECILIKKHTGS